MRKRVVGVMGGHEHHPETEELAAEVGRRIAKNGWVMLNGGRNEGVMAASARGCREAGGFSVGLHPGDRHNRDVAPDLDLVIFTDMGFARNSPNVQSSDVVIALRGGTGTLSEVAYARTYGIPVVLLGFDDKGWFGDTVRRAKDIDEAFSMVKAILGGS